MGRNKIKIEKITNERTRVATFNKRKNGLLKKAMELSILCGSEVALIVIGNNKLTQYSSSDMDQLLLRYTDGGFDEPQAIWTNQDYHQLFEKKKNQDKESTPNKRARVESEEQEPQTSPSTRTSSPMPPPSAFHSQPAPAPTLAPAPSSASAPSSVRGLPVRLPPQEKVPASSESYYHPMRSVPYFQPQPISPRHPYHPLATSHVRQPSGYTSPAFEGSQPLSPHSTPATPPGSGGQQRVDDTYNRRLSGRFQEQQFSHKLNKKNLSLTIPEAASVSASFPGSSGYPRYSHYPSCLTGLHTPSTGLLISDSDHHQPSATVLPSPSSFFNVETPGHDGPPTWTWFSPRPDMHQDTRFLSMAFQEGVFPHQITHKMYGVGDKRKISDLKA
jgi:hypothetical protein